MARATKLTAPVRAAIVANLAHGATIQTACVAAGIHRGTYYDWKQKADAGEQPFAAFFKEIEQAEAQAEMTHLKIVEQATQEDWKAAIWWLERRHPETWGRRDRFEHTSPQGQPVAIRHEGSEEALAKYAPVVASVLLHMQEQERSLQEGAVDDHQLPDP